MNCRQFQHDLYEYLEGSLGAGAQAAAAEHLEGCVACRERVREEQAMARSLVEGFRRVTQPLELPAQVRRRVMAAVANERAARLEERGPGFFWRRLAWPAAWAASAAVALAGWLLFVRAPGQGTGSAQPHPIAGGIVVQLSYVVPIYTFRQEGGLVVDAVTYQTNVVNQRLQTELASLR